MSTILDIMGAMTLERDLPVPMRDGVRLFVNLFRHTADGSHPVIMSVTPYGKDKLPDRLANFFMRLSGVKFGKLNCSRLTGFESPDPLYPVQQGYAVLQADVRGTHKSEGQAGVLRQQDAEDYYDLIEWAASQPWCTGRVGLMGVSYLASRSGTWRRASHLTSVRSFRGRESPIYTANSCSMAGYLRRNSFPSGIGGSNVGAIAGFRWQRTS